MGQEYQVLSIREMPRISPGGDMEKVYRHRIQTRAGVVLSVDVHERDWTEEKVAKRLLAEATKADAIMKL